MHIYLNTGVLKLQWAKYNTTSPPDANQVPESRPEDIPAYDQPSPLLQKIVFSCGVGYADGTRFRCTLTLRTILVLGGFGTAWWLVVAGWRWLMG